MKSNAGKVEPATQMRCAMKSLCGLYYIHLKASQFDNEVEGESQQERWNVQQTSFYIK